MIAPLLCVSLPCDFNEQFPQVERVGRLASPVSEPNLSNHNTLAHL
jgi:hypothetical protein